MSLFNQSISYRLQNFSEFKSAVVKYGYSMSNLFDIQFVVPGGAGLYNALAETFFGANFTRQLMLSDNLNLMRLYTTECSMPGLTMSSGEYRVTNTPQLKYAYGSVFGEFTVTFILDAESNIRKVFDEWTNLIYPYSSFQGSVASSGPLRTSYKDDYIADITVIKYERGTSSTRNKTIMPSFLRNTLTKSQIIPDIYTTQDPKDLISGFYKNVPVHAVRMKNAFPSNITSVSLSSDGGSLTQFTVSFEYESLQVL